MRTAYRIPDMSSANVRPGQTGFKTVPINRMNPRSFVTNRHDGDAVKSGVPALVRGMALGSDKGVKAVDVSTDGGAT